MGILNIAAATVFAGSVGFIAAGGAFGNDNLSSGLSQHWQNMLTDMKANDVDIRDTGHARSLQISPLLGTFNFSSHLFENIGLEQTDCFYSTSGMHIGDVPIYIEVKGGCGEQGQSLNEIEETTLSRSLFGIDINL